MRDEEKRKNDELAERLIAQQNFVAGAIAALFSAVAYGVVVERWPFAFGFAAAGVGIVVGFFMGLLGQGISMRFSVLVAVYTLSGCVLGNLCLKIRDQVQGPASSIAAVLQNSSLSDFASWSVSGLSLIRLVFWVVAVAAAVFLARRPLSRAQRLALGSTELRG